MLYPLSYSRTAGQCSKDGGTYRAGTPRSAACRTYEIAQFSGM